MAFLTSGGSQVTSGNIVDGSILNADINSAAGISMSKLDNPPLLELADVTLGGAGLTINSGAIAAKRFIRILLEITGNATAVTNLLRFNGDSSANYSRTISANSAGATNNTAQTFIEIEGSGSTTRKFYVIDIINVASLPKIVIVNGGNQGNMQHCIGTWNNTADLISSIEISAVTNLSVGTRMQVFGND